MLRVYTLSLGPEIFEASLNYSVVGKALNRNLWSLHNHNIRDFSHLKHSKVDDRPCGGGPGMLLRPDVVDLALRKVTKIALRQLLADKIVATSKENTQEIEEFINSTLSQEAKPVFVPAFLYKHLKFIFLSPRGQTLTQEISRKASQFHSLVILCGHYEGIDQRVIDLWPFEEISLGDFIVSNGVVAASALIDSIVRLLPEVLGNKESWAQESFTGSLLEHHQYTKPVNWQGLKVPNVLLEGHHGRINAAQRSWAKELTAQRRQDLWQKHQQEE